MRKGFTLIELLVIVVVISLIALIAVPVINNLLLSARKTGFYHNAKSLVKFVQLDRENQGYIGMDDVMEYVISSSNNNITYNSNPLSTKFEGNISGDGVIYVDIDGNVALVYTDNNWCAYKDYLDGDISVKSGDCIGIEVLRCNQSSLVTNLNPSGWSQAKYVSLSYDHSSSCNSIYYKFSGESNYSLYNNEILVDTNTTLGIKLTSSINDDAEFDINVPNIDRTAPTNVGFTYTRNETSLVITATAIDTESGIYGFEFSVDGGTTWSAMQTTGSTSTSAQTKTFTYDSSDGYTSSGTYEIVVRATNNAYQNTASNLRNINIGVQDSLAVQPLLLPSVTISPSGNTWAAQKTVTIGEVSGYTVAYSIDGGTTFTTGNSVTLYSNTNVVVRLSNGTDSSYITQNVSHIDASAPTVSVSSIVATTRSLRFNINVTEPDSPYTTICEYGLTNSYGSSVTAVNNVCEIDGLSVGEKYYYKITTTNSSGLSAYVAGDTSVADFSTITIASSPSDSYSAQKTITISVSSQVPGATLQYQIGSTTGTWQNYSSPFVINENTTIYARLYDGHNVSEPATLTITTIALSTSQFTYSNVNYTDGEITVQEAIEELYNLLN